MATTATPWINDYSSADKLCLQSGQFTSTIKTSQNVGDIDTSPQGISWDGTNTPWCGQEGDKLYLQSGQFTSTLKTSQTTHESSYYPAGISVDNNGNTPWCGNIEKTLFLTSGQFSSTIKISQSVIYYADDISFDGTNTPWITGNSDVDEKLLLQSGQFTSTIITSQDIGSIEVRAAGISWDGINTPWCGRQDDKLYLQSGQFTSTLKTSEHVGGYPLGICTNDFSSRVGGLDQTIDDNLTLVQEVIETIIRVPLNIQPTSNALTFIDEAGCYTGKLEPFDVLSFIQDVTILINVQVIKDVLVFTQIVRQPITYEEIVVDVLTFTQNTTEIVNTFNINDILSFEQFADLRGGLGSIGRNVIDILTLTDSATVDTHFYAFHITDNLDLQQSIILINPINFSIIDTLIFDDLPIIRQPYNESVTVYFNWIYDSDGYPLMPRANFEQKVDRQFIASRGRHQTLTLNQNVLIVKEKITAISKSADNTLTFTQSAARVYGGISTLTFSQTVSVDQCIVGKNTLIFEQIVGYSHKTNYNTNNTLILESTVAYNLITTNTLRQYQPFIGDSTVSDAPRPPHQIPQTIVKYNNVQLFYPPDNPTMVVTLRGPEFDDRDQLHFSRINRETRGGTLIVFSDPMWPQNQRLLLNFVGLNETEAQDTLTLIETTIGKQIGLRDWEGKEWVGVILTPNNPITRNRDCNIGLDIEFEGAQVYREEINQILAPLVQIVKVVTYQRPWEQILTLIDVFDHNVDYDRPITDTLTLIPTFDYNVNYDRPITDTLTLIDSIINIKIMSPSIIDSFTLIDTFDYNVNYTRPITDSLTLLDQIAPHHDTAWMGQVNDKLYLQSGQFTSTLKTSQYIGDVDETPTGISFDGIDTFWSGSNDNKLYLQSGRFTSTVKTSQYIGDVDAQPRSTSCDRINTPWGGSIDDKLYLQSGQFTSTIKTSQYIGDIDVDIVGISFDSVDTPWCGFTTPKLCLQSGQFTSTLKTSQDVSNFTAKTLGISWNGIDTPWASSRTDKLYLQSGQFTSTLKTSQDISSVDGTAYGIEITSLPFRLSK